MSRTIIVNADNEILGYKERDEITPGDMYRISTLWLTNSKGEILLAQRALTKKNSPGKWGPAVAGTIEEGDTFESNIVKEIGEELGLLVHINELTKGPYMKTEGLKNNYFIQWFLLRRDIDIAEFKIEPKEVAQIQWFTKEDLIQKFAENPENFTAAAGQWLPALMESGN